MIPPVEKQVSVQASPEEAFTMFTDHLGRWWPLATHSVFQASAASVELEPRRGGRIIEGSASGETSVWGTITEWDPPHSLIFTWHPGRDESTAQQVEVRFEAKGDRTSVTLVHRGWEALGEAALEMRDMYEGGWASVFDENFSQSFSLGRHTLIALRHLPGPAWEHGTDFREQPGIEGHLAFMQELFNGGTLLFGGPILTQDGGGIAVLRGVDADRAQQVASRDPSVQSGLLTVEVWPWLVPMTTVDSSR